MSLESILECNAIDNKVFEESLDSLSVKQDVKELLKIENKYKKSLKLTLEHSETVEVSKIHRMHYFFLE